MTILMTILAVLFIIFCVYIAAVIISFLMEVPTQLEEIAIALRERNEIEKEKLKIMKNDRNNE